MTTRSIIGIAADMGLAKCREKFTLAAVKKGWKKNAAKRQKPTTDGRVALVYMVIEGFCPGDPNLKQTEVREKAENGL